MLAELHARLAVNPHRLRNSADRALPHICRNPCAPGDIHRSRQRYRSILFRFHRLVVARAADPPGFLLVPGPGPALLGIFFNIPGAFLPAGPARGLRLRDLEFFVFTGSDGTGRVLIFSRGW